MKVEDLLDAATTATGLEDFGPASYREGLERWVDSLVTEGDLHDIGRAAAEGQTLGLLVARLKVQDWCTRHPEVADEDVEAPLFVTGMSRSGTTALSHLLSVDPANRSLLGWEASDPVPPPAAGHYDDDPRFVAARAAEFGALDQLNPEFKSMHHDPPDMPTECVVVLAQAFCSLSLPTTFFAPSYLRWVLEADQTDAYRWHAGVLRLLQSGGVRGAWQLKTPQHGMALDALFAAHPGARVVVCHREPATCVTSTASLTRSLTGTWTDVDHGRELGRDFTDVLDAITTGIVDFRAREGDDRFVDVAYRDLVADPVGTVARIYDGVGRTLSTEAEAAMRRHTEVHVQHRWGRHTYDPADFGLDPDALNERFGAYRDRFAEFLA